MAAIDADGKQLPATDRHSNRCQALNAKGNQCGAWALRGEEVCQWHSLSEEEQKEQTKRAGRARARQRRERAELRDSSRHRQYADGPTLARAIDVIRELLDTTIPGTTEPNYEARAFGALALATLFRLRDKTEALEMLTRAMPKVAADPHVYRALDFEAARARLIEAYEAGRISAEELPPGVLGLTATPGLA